jgi:predicted transcriptional regulator
MNGPGMPSDEANSGSSMMLLSFRLPVALVQQIDELADRDRRRRADIIREALARYVEERTAPVSRDEAERALDVLRKLVESR